MSNGNNKLCTGNNGYLNDVHESSNEPSCSMQLQLDESSQQFEINSDDKESSTPTTYHPKTSGKKKRKPLEYSNCVYTSCYW